MTDVRCALISLGNSNVVARAALDRLRATKGLAVDEFRLTHDWSTVCGIDALILAIDDDAVNLASDAVARLKAQARHIPIFAVGCELDSAHITRLFAEGVFDFVAASFTSAEFVARVRRALGIAPAASLHDARRLLNSRVGDFIGNSPRFLRQIDKLPAIAGCDAGVLIRGETGTGKEVCAQAIHYLSARAANPWVAVNCGAIPTELVENELFGHVKGAYTTAHTARNGLVCEAEGGTLFLDDIDCLPLSAQAKLLRFLQEREYRPVGSNAVRRADVRVIAAGNQRLAAMVAGGQFRQDLYYRLNVLTLELPPLRERQEDIALLARHFLRLFSQRYTRQVAGVSPAALARLIDYDWPGNVRELQHVIERAVLLTAGPVLSAADIDLCAQPDESTVHQSFREAKAHSVRKFERSYIERLLLEHGGNVSHAAQTAKKDRRAFFQLIVKHGIDLSRFRVLEK